MIHSPLDAISNINKLFIEYGQACYRQSINTPEARLMFQENGITFPNVSFNFCHSSRKGIQECSHVRHWTNQRWAASINYIRPHIGDPGK